VVLPGEIVIEVPEKVDSSDAGSLFETVDVRDVGMVEGGQRLRFAGEAGEAFRDAPEKLGHDLQGDVAVEPGVPGAIDLARAARAEERGPGLTRDGEIISGPAQVAEEGATARARRFRVKDGAPERAAAVWLDKRSQTAHGASGNSQFISDMRSRPL
jgi:hypothetical protein